MTELTMNDIRVIDWVLYQPAEGCEHLADCHIVPEQDIVPHMLSETCWCHPHDDPQAYETVFVHNAKDGREAYQSGTRKPN